MATIFDTAKYILKKQGQLSTMKLQKLCYYSQAWSLVFNDKPLFEEDFQAWTNGPVCPELYQVRKGHFSVNYEQMQGDESCLNPDQIDTIQKVLDYYGDKNAQWLSDLTHLETPWVEARGFLPFGAACTNIITKESMAMYYGSL